MTSFVIDNYIIFTFLEHYRKKVCMLGQSTFDVNMNFQTESNQFYNFVNAKRKSSALPSSVRLNSIEASTDLEIAALFTEFFQSTYSSDSWSNSNYPKPLYRSVLIQIRQKGQRRHGAQCIQCTGWRLDRNQTGIGITLRR